MSGCPALAIAPPRLLWLSSQIFFKDCWRVSGQTHSELRMASAWRSPNKPSRSRPGECETDILRLPPYSFISGGLRLPVRGRRLTGILLWRRHLSNGLYMGYRRDERRKKLFGPPDLVDYLGGDGAPPLHLAVDKCLTQ